MVLHELRLPNIQIFLLWNEELSIAPDALTMGSLIKPTPVEYTVLLGKNS